MSRAQINMLEGSLVGPIFQFAIPVAMIGILQQMFNTADIMVLGRFVGTEALAAVGNNAPVIGVLVNLFLGISLGANVLIARKLGGGRLKEASEAIHTTVLMAGLTGLFILVVGEIFAGPLMGWMGVPLEVREASELYLRVYLLGMPGMTLYDFLSAIYRSHGNVRTPLLSLVTASIVNIAGNLLAVFLGFGLAGVVTVTAIANYISSGLLLRLLRYEHGVLHFIPVPSASAWRTSRKSFALVCRQVSRGWSLIFRTLLSSRPSTAKGLLPWLLRQRPMSLKSIPILLSMLLGRR